MTTVTAKRLFGTSAGITFAGIVSLPTDANRLVGKSSSAVDISALTDPGAAPAFHMIGGRVKTGTGTLTAGFIEIFLAATENGSNYAGGITSAASVTLTTEAKALLKLLWRIPTNTTVSTIYELTPKEISSLFGGALPRGYCLWAAHSTGQNLASSGSGFSFTSQSFKSE